MNARGAFRMSPEAIFPELCRIHGKSEVTYKEQFFAVLKISKGSI